MVLLDHALNESSRAFALDFRIPDQPPDPRVVGIAERAADLLAADHPTHSDLLLGQPRRCIGLQRMNEIPAVEIEDDGAGFGRSRLSQRGREVGWEEASQAYVRAFEAQLGIQFEEGELSESESKMADELVIEKYNHPSWTERV